jgi:protein-S-isoprenylcysteine O-methyltransferase Ste14
MTSIAMERISSQRAVQGEEISAYTASFGLSLGLTSIFNALLVVIKETNEHTVLEWMKASGHHWVTQGVLDIIVFVALGLLLAQFVENWRAHPDRVTAAAIGGVVVGALIISGFYLRNVL